MLGHDEAWREWRAALAGERLHHAWILAGRKGLGKASFALDAAAELLARDGGQTIAAAAHPDVLRLEPLPDGDDEERKRADGKPFRLKRNITIDQIRAAQRRLITRPTLGAHRAVIVDSADDLERGAFNALLKSLEEPPQGTIFLLVAHRPGRLPATIRSRCRALRFGELDEASVARVLDAQAPGLSPPARAAALAVAAGSPGAALAFAERNLGDAYGLMIDLVAKGDPDFAARGALLSAIGQRPDREQQVAAIEAGRHALLAATPAASRERQARSVEAHAALVRLLGQVPTANFDPATLVLEIGGLLASVAADREAA